MLWFDETVEAIPSDSPYMSSTENGHTIIEAKYYGVALIKSANYMALFHKFIVLIYCVTECDYQ